MNLRKCVNFLVICMLFPSCVLCGLLRENFSVRYKFLIKMIQIHLSTMRVMNNFCNLPSNLISHFLSCMIGPYCCRCVSIPLCSEVILSLSYTVTTAVLWLFHFLEKLLLEFSLCLFFFFVALACFSILFKFPPVITLEVIKPSTYNRELITLMAFW